MNGNMVNSIKYTNIKNPQIIADRGLCRRFEVTTNQSTMANLSNSAQELWSPISELPYYQISNFGRVRSLDRYHQRDDNSIRFCKGRVRKLNPDNHGYLIIYIQGKTYKIHRLVAAAFIPNQRNCKQVNHIDGNKSNNQVSNLEWCTASENLKHAHKNGLKRPSAASLARLSNHHSARKVFQFSLQGVLLKEWSSIIEAGISFGAKDGTLITAVCKKRQRTGYGFRWSYDSKLYSDNRCATCRINSISPRGYYT
jgi:hypothetical protein